MLRRYHTCMRTMSIVSMLHAGLRRKFLLRIKELRWLRKMRRLR